MKKKMKNLVTELNDFMVKVNSHHAGAYAAQSAYFFVLSLIPIILLLLMMVQYTPVTKADVMTAVVKIFPSSVNGLIVSIVNQVYNQSRSVIPITAVVALWSAGKGVLSVSYGLNCVYDCTETRNYFYLRLRATFYTVIFIVAIVFSLVMSVFGNRISAFVTVHVPFLSQLMEYLMKIRTFLSLIVLTLFWIVVYKFLPNRKITSRLQLPGAVFTAIGWVLVSFIFSIYLDIFTGFSTMYGSLTTIVLIMLWLYFCMYIVLLGGEINQMWYAKRTDFMAGRGKTS